MNKDEYLKLIKVYPGDVLYNYYVEHLNTPLYKSYLDKMSFITNLAKFTDPSALLNVVCSYYDSKFSIIKVFDKEGKLIKII